MSSEDSLGPEEHGAVHPMSRKRKNHDDDAAAAGKRHKVDDSYNEDEMNTIYNHPKQFQGVMRKYWAQRHRLFSRYDEGILLTKELWFSVTPEKIAKYVAQFIADDLAHRGGPSSDGKVRILDAFCGGGGNITQFLQDPDNIVYAVDNNQSHLDCTRNNALVYCDAKSVDERLKLLPMDWSYAAESATDAEVDDNDSDSDEAAAAAAADDVYATRKQSLRSLAEIASVRFDCVFGSPPWGGPEYIRADKYDLDNLQPFGLTEMLLVLRRYSEFVCLFLPKNIDTAQLVAATTEAYRLHPPVVASKHGSAGPVVVKVHVVHMFTSEREKGVLVTWLVQGQN